MRAFILFLCLLSATGCKTKKSADDGIHSECKTSGKVKDFSGLDGCRFLIVLDNGDKLLPASVAVNNFEFKDGQQIRFDYKKIKDAMSICMIENMSVEITCITEVK